MFETVRVAAISLKPKKWDKATNAQKLEKYFREAIRLHSPQLIVAPEGVLEGYIVSEVIQNPKRAPEMLAISETIDGPYIRRFRSLAASLNTCICFGFSERVVDDIYNTAILIDGNGKILGMHRKVQFAEGTDPSWTFNRGGDSLRAFDTPFGRAGIVICNDRWNPMIVRTLVLDGAKVILIPSYGNKTRLQNKTVLARARENGVPIVEANVGLNLIISKGEVVAYQWGNDRITVGEIEVPAPSSTHSSRRFEAEFFRLNEPEMARRHRERLRELRGEENIYEQARVGHLIANAPELT